MLEYLRLGGPLMWLLFAAGAAMLVLFLERLFHVHRARIKAEDFLKGICTILRRKNHDAALASARKHPAWWPASSAAILNRDRSDEICRAIDRSAVTEIARLSGRSPLSTAAQVAPLLGLRAPCSG